MSLVLPNAFGHSYYLAVLEYCSPVLMSAATCHLSLLDRVVGQVSRLSGGSVSCDLWHRRKVASLCVFFKIDSLVDHPLRGLFPAQYVLRRPTRGALAVHPRSFEMPRSKTVQFQALLFSLVFDCGMGCMNLSLLVKVWVLLKLLSIAFFYKLDCPLFLPSLRLFLFHFSSSQDLK